MSMSMPIPAELSEIIATHNALFGGFTMMADEVPESPESEPSDAADDPEAPEVEDEGEQNGPDDWRENFDADKASARIRKLQNESKNLRERAKAAEEKAAGVPEKDSRISELQAENLRYRVGYKIGLPAELVDRLKGDTEEALIEDAQSLLNLVGSSRPPQGGRPLEVLRGGGKPDVQPEEIDVDKIGERMFRN